MSVLPADEVTHVDLLVRGARAVFNNGHMLVPGARTRNDGHTDYRDVHEAIAIIESYLAGLSVAGYEIPPEVGASVTALRDDVYQRAKIPVVATRHPELLAPYAQACGIAPEEAETITRQVGYGERVESALTWANYHYPRSRSLEYFETARRLRAEAVQQGMTLPPEVEDWYTRTEQRFSKPGGIVTRILGAARRKLRKPINIPSAESIA